MRQGGDQLSEAGRSIRGRYDKVDQLPEAGRSIMGRYDRVDQLPEEGRSFSEAGGRGSVGGGEEGDYAVDYGVEAGGGGEGVVDHYGEDDGVGFGADGRFDVAGEAADSVH